MSIPCSLSLTRPAYPAAFQLWSLMEPGRSMAALPLWASAPPPSKRGIAKSAGSKRLSMTDLLVAVGGNERATLPRQGPYQVLTCWSYVADPQSRVRPCSRCEPLPIPLAQSLGKLRSSARLEHARPESWHSPGHQEVRP